MKEHETAANKPFLYATVAPPSPPTAKTMKSKWIRRVCIQSRILLEKHGAANLSHSKKSSSTHAGKKMKFALKRTASAKGKRHSKELPPRIIATRNSSDMFR